ncbi:predicted protein, partial [Nematostella vectensis]
MAPSYANLFMAKVENEIIDSSPVKPYLWRRYIDDIFMIWTEGEDALREFMAHMNSIHRTIKFTFEWSTSQALRIRRICSEDSSFEKRVLELQGYLVDRGYDSRFVGKEVDLVRHIPRDDTLKDRRK